jgi:hypothetical protein
MWETDTMQIQAFYENVKKACYVKGRSLIGDGG